MSFKKEIKYGSVTLDFIVECAKLMKLDMNAPNTLRQVLHLIGFQVSVFSEEDGQYVPCRIDRMNNVNVRCVDRPYMYRKTTVFSGRLREKSEFPLVNIYDEVDILDIGNKNWVHFVNDLDFDIPTVDKVNTRKYTKKEDRSEVIIMDLPDCDYVEAFIKGSAE